MKDPGKGRPHARARYEEFTRVSARITEDLAQALRSAGFDVELEVRYGRRELDFVVKRPHLGREHRYAIDLKMRELNQSDITRMLGTYEAYNSRYKETPLDEIWLVTDDRMSRSVAKYNIEHSHLRVFGLQELKDLLVPPKSKRKNASAARTKVGKAVLANQTDILLVSTSLTLQIEEKLSALRGERPNSPDAIEKQETAIADFERMLAELQHIRKAITEFKKDAVKEKEVVNTVTTFSNGIRSWWNKNHAKICADSYTIGLFATAVSVCNLAGANPTVGIVVAGALAGGKTVVDAIKAIPKKLPPI